MERRQVSSVVEAFESYSEAEKAMIEGLCLSGLPNSRFGSANDWKDVLQSPRWFAEVSSLTDRTQLSRAGVALYMGAVRHLEKALWCWTRAAQAYEPNSAFCLGICHHFGTGVARDAEKAFEWFSKASSFGHKEAYLYRGRSLLRGIGCKADEKAAIEELTKGSKEKHFGCKFELAMILQKTEPKESIKLLRDAAEHGEEQSYYALAMATAKNGEKIQAHKYFSLAASLGNAQAMNELGRTYKDGVGCKKSVKRATKWLKKASDAGIMEATAALGALMIQMEVEKISPAGKKTRANEEDQEDKGSDDGNGKADRPPPRVEIMDDDDDASAAAVPPKNENVVEGLKLLRRAAAAGVVEAQYDLARNFKLIEPAEAVQFAQSAAEKGHRDAMQLLASWHESGVNGVAKDASEASKLRKKAEPPKKPCAQCGGMFEKLLRCGRCHGASYCSQDCQKKHYPTHKQTCQAKG